MRKRDLAARIEALEKRVRSSTDYRVMQDQINKLRANMEMARETHSPRVYTEADLPPNGPTVQLPADSDALIDTRPACAHRRFVNNTDGDSSGLWCEDCGISEFEAWGTVNVRASREPSKAEWLQSEVDGLEKQLAAANEHIAAQDSELAQARRAHARTKELLGETRQELTELRDKVGNFKRAFE